MPDNPFLYGFRIFGSRRYPRVPAESRAPGPARKAEAKRSRPSGRLARGKRQRGSLKGRQAGWRAALTVTLSIVGRGA
jgi:hypothetical protein